MPPKMRMNFGNIRPVVMNSTNTATNTATTNKLKNVNTNLTPLKYSMFDRLANSQPGCGACGK